MESYKYKSGEEVQENDICFYSEYREGSPMEHHYADGISRMEIIKGELRARTYVFTMDEARSFKDYVESDENTVGLEWCCHFSTPNVLSDFTLIGKSPQDDHILKRKYAQSKYRKR